MGLGCGTVDSVSVCFSKGLGAPVGSALVGPRDFIQCARKVRKFLGGGMRQAGIIAAGALWALHHHHKRLGEDHRRAQQIAQALQSIPGLSLLYPVDTNMVFVQVDPPERAKAWITWMKDRGILFLEVEPGVVRIVTHLDVNDQDVQRFVSETWRFFET